MIFSKSIYVAAKGNISFFFMSKWYSIIYILHIYTHTYTYHFLNQSSVNGHLDSFYVFAVVNSAVIIGVNISFWIRVFVFPVYVYPGVELLIHMVAVFLVKKGISMLFSILVVPAYIPTSSMVFFLHTFSSIYYLWTFWWWSFWPVWGDTSLWFLFAFL